MINEKRRSALRAVIEKLERADVPQFNLDQAIWHVIHPTDYWSPDPLPPAFTGIIDKALILLPDGWQWKLSNRAPKPHAGRAYINNRMLTFDPKYVGFENTAYTPAIALCIACLRAREAMMDSEEV